MQDDLHEPGELYLYGPEPGPGSRVLLLLHGRGSTAESILLLGDEIAPKGTSLVAPQAVNSTWYPHSFMRDFALNEPWLSSALARVNRIVEDLLGRGVKSEDLALAGFSQGACLTLEYTMRYPRRYLAAIGLSGGLIGPPGTQWTAPGSLDGTPVFIGCSDIDDHIPVERIHESAEAMAAAGAAVDKRVYPGMGHTVNDDELKACRALLAHSP